MKVLDLIIDSAGLDREVDRARVEHELEPLLAAMDKAAGIGPDPALHSAMVDRVLGGLRNDSNRRRPFEVAYADFDEQGAAVRRMLEFRLVVDYFHPSGGIVLRLSNEAINLYLNALELDIEDAQAAAEAVVQSQLARGRFDEAVQSARNARWQSLRYEQKVTGIIRDTRRDVASIDWREQVPKLLRDALEHIDTRLITERNILNTAEERLQVIEPDDSGAAAVAEVVRLVRDCRLRHLVLHDQLMGARNVFLDEQARQAFARAALLPSPNLLADVLEPVLRLDRRQAGKALAAAFPFFAGSQPPALFSLAEVVSWLLRPRRGLPQTDVPVIEPDLTRAGLDVTRFDPDVRAQVEELLAVLQGPTALSSLLGQLSATGAPRAALELMTLTALHAFAPEQEENTSLLVDRLPGVALDSWGFFGDDLQLLLRGGEDVEGRE